MKTTHRPSPFHLPGLLTGTLASLLGLLPLLSPAPASAQTQTYPCETVIQIGSGTSTNGAKLRPGAIDPFFDGTDATFPNPPNSYVLTDPPAAWIANSASADSQWIGPSSSTGDDVAGTSVYRMQLVLPCAGGRLTGRYAASDRGTIGLNGTINQFPTPAIGSTAWTSFSFNNLLAGLNRLEFYVTKSRPPAGGLLGASGLRVELTATATCCPCIELTCPSDVFLTTCSNGASANFSITGTNRCFTNLTINCSLASITGIPVTSGHVFPVGTNTVLCTASDTAGHRTNCSFRVTVKRDTEAPQIRCPQDIIYPCSVSGTNVFFAVTATDDTDPAPVVSCVPPSGSFFPAGTNTVVCTARDSCGNVGRCSFRVVLAPNGFTKTLQAGVADDFNSNDLEPANPGPCLGASGYWTGMPFDTYFPGRHLSASFEGLPDNLSAATLILRMKPRLTMSQDDMLRIGLQNCGGAGVWAFAVPVASLPGAGGTWVTNLPTIFTLDLAALPGGVNLLAGLNANHRLEFAVGTETLVDYARLEVTYCGPQSTLSGVPYSLNNAYPIHQGEGVSWRTVNSNGPPPTISLDIGRSDGLRFDFGLAIPGEPSLNFCHLGGPVSHHHGLSTVIPTGHGTTATMSINASAETGRTRISLSQPLNFIGKSVDVWNAAQPVTRYFLPGTADTAVEVNSHVCLSGMGFFGGYFFAGFESGIPESPAVSIWIVSGGQHVSGQVGTSFQGDSVRLSYGIVEDPASKEVRVQLPPGGFGVAGISLLHNKNWIKPYGPQLMSISDSVAWQALPQSSSPYGVCIDVSTPTLGGWTLKLNGVADFCKFGSVPNLVVCNNGYVDVNIPSLGGGLRLTPTSLPQENCTIQNTLGNSITVNRVSGGPVIINGATLLSSEGWPISISGNFGVTTDFPPSTTVSVNGQSYLATSAFFHYSGQLFPDYYEVCLETTLLPQFSFNSFQTFVGTISPPCLTLTCPTNVTVNCTNAVGTVVTFNPSGATRCGGNVVITCDPPSGSLFPPGARVVLCSAIDSQGNQERCEFLVTVLPTCPLTVRRLDPNRLELHWVGAALIEAADALSDRPVWHRVTGTPTSSGIESVLVVPIDRRQQFYRAVLVE